MEYLKKKTLSRNRSPGASNMLNSLSAMDGRDCPLLN